MVSLLELTSLRVGNPEYAALNKSFGERACDGIGGVAAKAVLAEIEAQGAEIVFPGEVPSWLAEVRHIRTRGTE